MKASKPIYESTRLLLVKAKFVVLLALVLLAVSACAANTRQLWDREVQRGWPVGFRPMDIPAPPFRLAGLLKGQSGTDLVVYLEGDGRAVVRGRPANDPTPSIAQSFDLALLDPAPLVLYLARVGQFMPAYTGFKYQVYWSSGRFASEVAMAANYAIDVVKQTTGASRVHLIGFSGGGGLAVLVAARRTDVASLVTVAGLLDIDWWVKNNGWQPLTDSLNPADFAQSVAMVPQIHFYGLKDRIITPAMSLRFSEMARFADLNRIGLENDHYSGWTPAWPALLTNQVLPLRRKAIDSQPTHEPI
jgi:hypothetical protein